MTADTACSPVIGVAELLQLMGSPALLLVDCRFDLANPSWGRSAYEAAHLPGAVYAHLDDALSGTRTPGKGRHPLPSAGSFALGLGAWGFTAGSRVVAYDQGNSAHAARLWWMLRARGHAAVQVLDGGIAAWQAAGHAVNGSAPAVAPTKVDAREFAGVLSTEEVQAGLATGTITLVDARSPDRFAGRNETIDPVAGHVPGALNHPFATNLDSSQHFLGPAELRQRWAPIIDRPGLAPLVAMCGSGVTACHNLVALELAGYCGARLYAGSFSEWISDPQRSVATGESTRD